MVENGLILRKLLLRIELRTLLLYIDKLIDNDQNIDRSMERSAISVSPTIKPKNKSFYGKTFINSEIKRLNFVSSQGGEKRRSGSIVG